MDGLAPVISADDVLEIAVLGRSMRVLRGANGTDCSAFWSLFARAEWEPRTLAMIDVVARAGATFYDIGAWIGPTTLWAAAAGSRVFAFEPDPVALPILRANIALNVELARRIDVVPAAAGDHDRMITLYNADFGNSETSIFPTVQRSGGMRQMAKQTTVPVIDLVQFINRQAPQIGRSFIMMDIEGAEFELIPLLYPLIQGYDIPLCVTFHPFNITGKTAEETLLRRIESIAGALRPYADMVWSVFEIGRFTPVDRAGTVKNLLNNLGRNSTIIISKNQLSI